MPAESEAALLASLLETSREQLRWQKVAFMPIVKDLLASTLESDVMREAYEMCDGTATFRDVSAATGVSIGTLSGWSRRWRELGLAYEDQGGRIRHLVSLGALGMSAVPSSEPRSARRVRKKPDV